MDEIPDDPKQPSGDNQSRPALIRPLFAGASRAITDLQQHGMLSPAEAALARVRAFWKAETEAADAEGIDLQKQAQEHWEKNRPVN